MRVWLSSGYMQACAVDVHSVLAHIFCTGILPCVYTCEFVCVHVLQLRDICISLVTRVVSVGIYIHVPVNGRVSVWIPLGGYAHLMSPSEVCVCP